MDKSEDIKELASALSSLQGEVKDVNKDKKGYGYQYADLSQILEIARPLLAKHGLALSQFPGSAGEKVTIDSILMHKSGQWISGVIEMQAEQGKGMSKAQSVGSVITYARRYAAAAILGIAQTDDDASINQPVPKANQRLIPVPKQAIKEPQSTISQEEIEISEKTRLLLIGKLSASNVPDEAVEKWLEKAKAASIEDLSEQQALKIIAHLEKKDAAINY